MAVNSRLPISIKECLRTSLCRASLLVVALGFLPSASFAHSVSCGNSNAAAVAINTGLAWVELTNCNLDLTDFVPGGHDCVVTASADIDNPGGLYTQNRYRFAVSLDGAPAVVGGALERMAVLPNNAGIPASENVTTVGWFSGLAQGIHNFASYARKRQVATTTTNATDYSLGVVCVDHDPNPIPPDQDLKDNQQ